MSGGCSQVAGETTGTVIRRASVEDTDSVSTAVLQTLDSLPNFQARASDEPLFDAIDPDALDRLFSTTADGDRTRGYVCFSVDGYEVRVNATGEIVVRTGSD